MLVMSTVPHHQPISVDDYLSGEQMAERKHEYVEGVVYAMAGATNTHNRIATNATGVLHSHLRGKPCQVFNSDAKVRVRLARGTRFYYPDTMVACRLNPTTDTFQDAPVVIVEIISESTRRTDENEKREAYLSIDSLCVYVLVEQASATAIVHRRTDSGFTLETHLGPDATISLPEIECSLALSELYEDVDFPPPPSDGDEYGEEF
jgi:Uma2 family endonuclease